MPDRWIVTPRFFEQPEPALIGLAPADAAINSVEITHRSPPELAILHGGIAQFVYDTLVEGDRPVSVAGDCCAALPVLAGMQRAGIAPDLVWIDAHGDFNTPETSPSQFLGGMPLAIATGRGPLWMGIRIGLETIPDERVLLVGARDIDPGEAEALEASRVTRIALEELAEIEFDGPVMVHFDADVIDPADCPAFAYPAPGGPPLAAVTAALADLAARAELRAISVSGWSGGLDRDRHTARGVARAVAALTG
ncbi:arginase [Paralimibaculum aggregatum]|uniref:Arginase n=1 Tax=Paralimibaculum aggregatum TaxID=3036245 RepID=A0ABQ6LJG2_9RHOB|nr:arginase family protein [Limibaculum sp. NKW23]GMG83403.1 arginase [Limibaculum sp. NKW23]